VKILLTRLLRMAVVVTGARKKEVHWEFQGLREDVVHKTV